MSAEPEIVSGSEIMAGTILSIGIGLMIWSDMDPMFVLLVMLASLAVIFFTELGTVFRADARSEPQKPHTCGRTHSETVGRQPES